MTKIKENRMDIPTRDRTPSAWRLLFLSLLSAMVLAVGFSAVGPRALALPPADPAEKAFHGFDLPAASATAIVTDSLTPTSRYPIVAYAITISLEGTDSVVNWTCSDGTTTYKDDLNSGTALTAGNVYTFLVGARRSTDNKGSSVLLLYNLECETTTRIRRLQIDEVRSDVR